MKGWLIGLIVASMIALVGCADPTKQVTVPDVIGLPVSTGIYNIQEAKLQPAPKEGKAAEEASLEEIIYLQSPSSGTRVNKNSFVEFTYYGEVVAPKQRNISILWNADEKWLDDFGGTHIVGFSTKPKPDWYPPHKIKLILYLKTDDLQVIEAAVIKWRDHQNLGGYWFISGHEPDITGTDPSFEEHKKLRRNIYELVRRLDPDKWNHPVVIFYNCTGKFAHYPGWEEAFQAGDHDVYAADIYANKCDGTTDFEGLRRAANDLVKIGLERSPDTQFIPCLGAFVEPGCQAASLLEQWEFWDAWYLEQTGEHLKGVAYYFSGYGSTSEGVCQNEKLAEEAKEINRRLGLLK